MMWFTARSVPMSSRFFPSERKKNVAMITRWKRNSGVDSLIYPSKRYTDTANLFGCIMENAVFSFSLSLSLSVISSQASNEIVEWKPKMKGKNDHMNTYKWSTMKYGINIRGMLLHKHVKQWIYNRARSENGWLQIRIHHPTGQPTVS